MEEVHLEPQSETITNVEPETQPAVEEPVEEERAAKRQKTVSHTKEEEIGSDKDFVFEEAKDLWNRLLADKGFVNERGFGKLISHFYDIIEREVGRASVHTWRLNSLLWLGNSMQTRWG